MKRNVDLTENRDFNRFDRWGVQSSNKWKIGSQSYLGELVITGTKDERNGKRMEMEFCSPNGGCDCCGSKIPWGMDGGLCNKCAIRMEQEKYKTWRDK
jgi:hypothetical protein